MYKPKNKIQISNLNCGAKLLQISDHYFPFEIVSVWVRAGSRFDPISKEGLAHLFEHLFMTTTKQYKSQSDKNIALESDGIFFNAFTNKEIAYYHQSQLPDKTTKSLDILLEGLTSSVFDQAMLDSEKNVVLDESALNKNNVEDYIWDLSFSGLFKDSKLASYFYGDKKSLESITVTDLEQFRQKYYQANNFYFVIISNHKHNLLVNQINNYFKDKATNSTIDFSYGDLSKKELIKVEYRDIENIQVSLNYRLFNFSAQEAVILDFIVNYLANTWVSKLVTRLRLENKWVYWVDGYTFYMDNVGYLNLSFSIKKENLNSALAIIFEEIEKISYLKNIDVHKTSYKSNLVRKLASPYELLFRYGYDFTLGRKLLSMDEYFDIIDSIKQEDMIKVTKKFLNKNNLSASFIGKINKSEIDIT